MSAGCGMPPASSDSLTGFVKKDIMVAGVDQAFISAHPVTGGGAYTWTKRNYYLRLPKGYSPDKPFAIDMAGVGCGGNDTAGSSGDYTVPPGPSQMVALQVGLSYVPSSSVNSCSTYADDFTNTPETAYLNAIIDDISAKYCVNKNKIFVNGYSSGAWEAIMSGCTNQDRVRAYGVQVGGGLRIAHPTCMNKPVAAMYIVGLQDTGNPIGPLTAPEHDSYGSAPARDAQLLRNGCQGNGTAVWNTKYPKCLTYTGCPAKYPVVWCALDVNHGDGPHPMGADGAVLETYRLQGLWDFYDSLPAP